jgi:hypothetical protein
MYVLQRWAGTYRWWLFCETSNSCPTSTQYPRRSHRNRYAKYPAGNQHKHRVRSSHNYKRCSTTPTTYDRNHFIKRPELLESGIKQMQSMLKQIFPESWWPLCPSQSSLRKLQSKRRLHILLQRIQSLWRGLHCCSIKGPILQRSRFSCHL